MNNREQWGSRLGFILAASGSAVGLGNIWKYPHMAGQNGGAAFTVVYLICILIVGLPILLGELAIGRNTQLSPVGAFNKLSGLSKWKWVGFLGVASAFVILIYKKNTNKTIYSIVPLLTIVVLAIDLMIFPKSLRSATSLAGPIAWTIIFK